MKKILFYIFLLFILIILMCFGYKTKFNIFGNLIFSILFLVSAMRYYVGWDYDWYHWVCGTGNKLDYQYLRLELIPKLMIQLSWFTQSTQLFFIISSFLITFLFYISIKENSNDYLLSFFIFFTYPFFYLDSFSIIRQWMAIIIIFYFSKYLIDKKFITFILGVIIASLFHSSAIIVLLFIPLIYLNLDYRFSFFVVVFVFLFRYKLADIIISKLPYGMMYSNYITNNIGNGGNLILYINIIICLLILVFKNHLINLNVKNKFYINTILGGTIIAILFTHLGQFGYRVSIYFLIYIVYLIPDLINLFKQRDRILLKTIAIILFSLLFISYLYNENINLQSGQISKNPFVPYNIFINK